MTAFTNMRGPGLAVALALAVLLATAGVGAAQSALFAGGLQAPRGLSASGSDVLVAEAGSGRVLRIGPDGGVTVVVSGLPSVVADTPEGPLPSGVVAAIEADGGIYVVTGESPADGLESVFFAVPGIAPILVADLGAYEEANNTDGDLTQSGDPELLSNPFDLVSDGSGGLFISNSGANAVLHISSAGDITPYAVFENRDNPLFPNVGGPTMDQVPTGLEQGPDGALYLTTLTGFPFPTGAARVYRLEDMNSDGDALDDGEVAVYADGLTTATNLAFEPDGSLLVTEFSTDMLAGAPGRVVRISEGSTSEVIGGLVSPTGLAVTDDGTIVVTQEFAGIVASIEALAAAGPSPVPGPADTGSGSLAGQGRSPYSTHTLIAVLALVVAATVGARSRVAERRD